MAEPATIAELLAARAERVPGELGLAYWAGGVWSGWSWERYRDGAARAAGGLRAAGIERGDRVMLLVLEVDVTIELLFGAWAIGAVPVLVGLPYRLDDVGGFLDELRRTAQRLDAKALVVSEAFAYAGDELNVLVAGSLREAHAAVWDPPDPASPALIQLTSGSTGDPRGVVLSHASILEHLRAISEALPAGDGAREVTWLPLHHDMGLIGGLLYPLYNAFAVNVLSPLAFRSDPYEWLRTMSDVRATCTPAPPSAYAIATRLAQRAVADGLDLSALRCAMVGAEPIAPQVLRDFAAALQPCGLRPAAFFCVYGLAEATVAVTFPEPLGTTRFDSVDRGALERDARALPCDGAAGTIELVGVGRPLPGTELRIVRDDGMAAAEREVGEIHVRSASLMDGYYGEPDASAAAIGDDGWLRTGDLGYLAGGELFVTGRIKDLIIKGGQNLLPAPIEEIAGAVEGVRAGCVVAVGVPSPQRATELVYVVAETKAAVRQHAQLARRVRDALLARGIAVDRVELVAPGAIPRTTSGKVRRREVARALAEPRRPGDLPVATTRPRSVRVE
jgi:acyl-CoA synthetase (AMP-forming)/AMP-acid ligase II